MDKQVFWLVCVFAAVMMMLGWYRHDPGLRFAAGVLMVFSFGLAITSKE
jgi:hypothetical protein